MCIRDRALTLREVTDLERLIGRVVYGSAGGRDLVALSGGLALSLIHIYPPPDPSEKR